MHEVEITEIQPLNAGDRSVLDLHSMLNVFNVLRGELMLIGLTLGDNEELLSPALAVCDRLVGALRNPPLALALAREIETSIGTMVAAVEAQLVLQPARRTDPEIVDSRANLDSVFAILRVRARELLARTQAPEQWVRLPVADLQRSFMDVFAAIEKNSRGRYRIIYNAALQGAPDYYVDFKIESVDGTELEMPPVFQDVMRDLIANARKYTAPGGHITAALHAGADALRFTVEDTGRGIPPGELQSVMEFGHRASNVTDVRTMGGGFGLTKAFLVTKQFRGRFWLGSTLGVGTRIRIFIPRPVASANRGHASAAMAAAG
jgi:signal transduction histidine kinase